jgi:hypothetical protein
MKISINKYNSISSAFLKKSVNNKKIDNFFVDLDLKPDFEKNIKNYIDLFELNSYNESISDIDFIKNKYFNKDNSPKKLSYINYLTLSKKDLQLFSLNDIPLIPSTEVIDFLSDVKKLKNDSLIEVNSGKGVIGENLQIKSFSKKENDYSSLPFSDIDLLNITLKEDQNKLISKIEIVDKNIASKIIKHPDIDTFIEENTRAINVNAYLNLNSRLINLSVLKDLHSLNLIYTVNDNYVIFLNEIEDYIMSFKSGESILNKNTVSSETDLTNIKKFLNKDIRIYFSVDNNYSELLLISFVSYFCPINTMADSFLEKTKSFSKIDTEKNLLLTTYKETFTKEVTVKIKNLLKSFDNIILEQGEFYYILSFDYLYNKISYSDNEIFLNVLKTILPESPPLSKDILLKYFSMTPSLAYFLTYVNVDENGDIDEDDIKWLNTQYSNISRLTTLFIKHFTVFEKSDKIVINIKDTIFQKSDIDKLYERCILKNKKVDYPERIIKASSETAIKNTFEKDDIGAVINHGIKNINLNKLYQTNNRLDYVIFDSLKNVLNDKSYYVYKYMILQSPFIITDKTVPFDNENCVLYVFGKKSKTNIDAIITKNNLKILKKNF